MPEEKKTLKAGTSNQFAYYDRAISWLSFNYRVLQEAMDSSLSLRERIKFLAIYQSNLDKFFRKVVTSYRMMLFLPKNRLEKLYFDPNEVLSKINAEVSKQEAEFELLFSQKIIPLLSENSIILIQDQQGLSDEHKEFVKQYFFSKILPLLKPIIIVKGELLQNVQENIIHLAIELKKSKNAINENQHDNSKKTYTIIELPTKKLPRFILLPPNEKNNYVIFLEDIIKMHLQYLFPIYQIKSVNSIVLIRNSKLKYEDDLKQKDYEHILKKLANKKTGMPARFVYDKNLSPDFLAILHKALNLRKKDLAAGFSYLNLADLASFPNLTIEQDKITSFNPIHNDLVDKSPSFLKLIKKGDYLFHFPYHSYNYVHRFFNEAALDPKTEEIKTTQYKLENNSAIVSSLISAALNGKKVSIYVDFKARFDESANLQFIEQMVGAGIQVIPSKPGLKIHGKAALIVHKKVQKDGQQKAYAYISTGNFNEITSQQYSDLGFFTSDRAIIDDLKKLFTHLEKPQGVIEFSQLIIPKYNFTNSIKELIDNEIENAKKGEQAYILIKINNLDDKKIIDQLYLASLSGVKIDLIVRSICCLVPGQAYSQNIRVIRIVDKYLEHSRVFLFHNSGKSAIYLSSADMMKSNLKRRIDVIVPIHSEKLKAEIIETLKIQLSDNTKARILGRNIHEWTVPNKNEIKIRSQIEIYHYLKSVYQ